LFWVFLFCDQARTPTGGAGGAGSGVSKRRVQGPLSRRFETWALAGHVASVQSSNASGANVAYTYDDLNRLDTVTDNNLPGQNTTT